MGHVCVPLGPLSMLMLRSAAISRKIEGKKSCTDFISPLGSIFMYNIDEKRREFMPTFVFLHGANNFATDCRLYRHWKHVENMHGSSMDQKTRASYYTVIETMQAGKC